MVLALLSVFSFILYSIYRVFYCYVWEIGIICHSVLAYAQKLLDAFPRSFQGRWFWYQSKARMRLPISN